MDLVQIPTISLGDPRYPAALAAVHDPPPILWTRGQPESLNGPLVAIVGSRAASPYALEVARRLGADLARRHVTVVSGLARGVDSAAHQGALDGGGITVAVFGCGADIIYPPEHARLAAEICERGALVSEFPPGTPPLPAYFPQRNRIISGLSLAVVVVEAAEKSGSLITARYALEQGREGLAVPGNILGGRNSGAHALLRDGAKIVEGADDILEEIQVGIRDWGFGIGARNEPNQPPFASQDPVLRCMTLGESYDLDELAHLSGMNRIKLLQRLLELELGGAVRRVEGGRFWDVVTGRAKVFRESMAKNLVIVESPAKAKTINKYLGRDYTVIASMGHVRDLPKSKLGVDVDDDFAPVYEPLATRKKVLAELRAAAKTATDIYVATDPDREGEAIGWHLAEELGTKKKKIHRLMFNEITKKAILEAMKHPGTIDLKMVDAQQARRVLDRLVGYKISPILWDKVRRGLSAGRVQSVALKLICDREKEIGKFVPVEYWHLFAQLAGPQPPEFEAKLVKKGDAAIVVGNETESQQVLRDLDGAAFTVASVAIKERKRNPAPPFITSKLQQTARYPVKRTMQIAQQLYEGIEMPGLGVDGPVALITYMRTDSTRVSEDALAALRDHIGSVYGAEYLPDKPNIYKTKADAQDAHEAIRPTSMEYDPEKVRSFLTPEQYSIYRLIWNRFVASQMPPATFDETTVDIQAKDYLFRVKGTVPKFPGWLAAYGQTVEEKPETEKDKDEGEESASGVLPPLAEGDRLELKGLRPEQKFTQPPPRFTEATLVKELEENGIGRPSTYASIIGVLQDREYTNKVEGKFKPTALGMIITDLLIKSFEDILDVEYTRSLEEDLDRIEQGEATYKGTLATFYKKFKKDLAKAGKEMQNLKEGLKTDEICDRCGKPMVIKVGKFGPFVACSGYPDCTNTRELEKNDPSETVDAQDEACENCGKPMVMKRGRFGQFLACTGYPDCKTTRKIISSGGAMKAAKPDQILDEKCPRCDSNLVIKQGRFGEFTACTKYPECKYVKLKSTGVKCPTDGGDIVERKSRRGKAFYGCANYPDCEFTLWKRPVPEACPTCGTPFLLEKITKKAGRQLVCSKDDCGYVRDAPLEEQPEEVVPA